MKFDDFKTNKESKYAEAKDLLEDHVGQIKSVGLTDYYLFKLSDGEPDTTGPKKPWIHVNGMDKPLGVNWSNLKVLKNIARSEDMDDLMGKWIAVGREYYDGFQSWGFTLRGLSNLEHKAVSNLPEQMSYQGQGTSTGAGTVVQPNTVLSDRTEDDQAEMSAAERYERDSEVPF